MMGSAPDIVYLLIYSIGTCFQEKIIKEKVYGKQKVYVADQSQFPHIDEGELKWVELAVVTGGVLSI